MSDVTIIDYGVGNVASIGNMLTRISKTFEVTADPERIAEARRLLLPGVGAFDHAAEQLASSGLPELLRARADAGVPFLGVCLGMQLLLDGSDEGDLAGLGLIAGRSYRFPEGEGAARLRVPHMGWNTITLSPSVSKEFPNVHSEDRYYFVHSYFVVPDDESHVVARTHYGRDFASMIRRGNVWGTQFHPEKSHSFGKRLLGDFASLPVSAQ